MTLPLVAELRAACRPSRCGAGRLPPGRCAVRARPEVPPGRTTRAGRAPRRVRRPAGPGRQLADGGRGGPRAHDRAVARPRRRPPGGLRARQARRRCTGASAGAPSPGRPSSGRSTLLEPLGTRSRAGPDRWPSTHSTSGATSPVGGPIHDGPRGSPWPGRSTTSAPAAESSTTAAAGAYLADADWRPLMHEAAADRARRPGPTRRPGTPTPTPTRCTARASFRFAEGERFWREGIAYCDERDMTTLARACVGTAPLALLDRGRWDEVVTVTDRVFATEAGPGQPAHLAGDERAGPRRGGASAEAPPSSSSVGRRDRPTASGRPSWIALTRRGARRGTTGWPATTRPPGRRSTGARAS